MAHDPLLAGLAAYFAGLINESKREMDLRGMVSDDIKILIAQKSYYDSILMNCDLFQYFISKYDETYYNFQISRKSVIAMVANHTFTSSDFICHGRMQSTVSECLAKALKNEQVACWWIGQSSEKKANVSWPAW